ncbi:MAG TPA: hypothetical protein VFN99_06990 [Gaiella sp.]|nr:hypothetical protein [Gaiella sp.]
MDLELSPGADRQTVAAARAAAESAGLVLGSARRPHASAWWRAGVEDAVCGGSAAPEAVAALPYDAARSPRSTRGATRA